MIFSSGGMNKILALPNPNFAKDKVISEFKNDKP